jgi:ParB-like chromosome segregation protein Spo0J
MGGKNSVTSYGAKGRRDLLLLDPDDVYIVGYDGKDPGHKLLDPDRVGIVEEKLVQSIMRYGVKVPITVTKEGDKVIVVAGRRRVLHARIANKRLREMKSESLIRVEAVINQGAVEKTFIIENTHRLDDNPVTRARKIERMRELGHTEDEIVDMFNISKGTLINATTLLKCVPQVLRAIEKGEIAASLGYELGNKSADEQLKALEAAPKGTGAGGEEPTKRQRTKAVRNRANGGSAKWSSRQIKELTEAFSPTDEEPYEDESVELAHRLLLVLLGDDPSGKGLKDFGSVHGVVKKLLKERDGGDAE